MNSYDPLLVHTKIMRNSKPALGIDLKDYWKWRRNLLRKLRHLVRLDAMPSERTPLNTRSLWKKKHEFGEIEKIAFTSESGHDIPAYVCIPSKVRAPYKFFICLQGHSTGMHNSIAVEFSDESKAKIIEGDRDFGIECMKRGIAAVCIEQRAFGECEDSRKHDNGFPRCHNPAMMAIMNGRTLLGERIFDVNRTIDYIISRGDADKEFIGVMGNSGGGTVSMFAGALLPRITHVMPSCSFGSFKDSIMSINHCICNYIPDLLLYCDCADIVALTAPKPLVIVNGKDDPIFPIQSAVESFELVRSVYEHLGAADKCRHVIGNGDHRFYAADAWPLMEKFLNGK